MQPLGRPAGKVVCVLFLCATMAYGREDVRGHMLVCCLTLGGQHVVQHCGHGIAMCILCATAARQAPNPQQSCPKSVETLKTAN